MATKAHLEGNKRYLTSKIDEIKVRVSKGRKAELQEYVKLRGESLNGFVNRAIEEQIKRDTEQ